jgi:hypothetical protein
MAAHQDLSSGGRIYWLCKLIQTRIIGNDIDAHIEKMGNYAEKLNALVTIKNPLTADNIHSTAILISLPADWLNCVLAMMNEEQVASSRVIAALKAKSLRRKARGDKTDPIVVAAPAVKFNPPGNDKSKNCTFCKRNGHNMASCNNLAKVIKEHKAQRHQEYLAKQSADSTSSKSKSPNSKTSTNKGATPARAGLASVVELDDFSGKEDNNLSGSNYSTYEVSRVATTSLAS